MTESMFLLTLCVIHCNMFYRVIHRIFTNKIFVEVHLLKRNEGVDRYDKKIDYKKNLISCYGDSYCCINDPISGEVLFCSGEDKEDKQLEEGTGCDKR